MPTFTVSLEVWAIDHEAAATETILMLRSSQLPVVRIAGVGSEQIIDLDKLDREQSGLDLEDGV